MSGPADGRSRFRRPAPLDPSSLDGIADARLDPAVITQVAHQTAAVLVQTGRQTDDPQVTTRLVGLVEEIGLATLAELWAERPARSLPGALWRLYVLHEWVRRDPVSASADYAAGLGFADVAGVVAGAASPPGPAEIRDLADAILRGVFDGDFGVALHRAAAFCRIVAAGRAAGDDPDEVLRTTGDAGEPRRPARTGGPDERRDPAGPQQSDEAAFDGSEPYRTTPPDSDTQLRRAAAVLAMADDLDATAGLWRNGGLD